jgi:hypothetical protein
VDGDELVAVAADQGEEVFPGPAPVRARPVQRAGRAGLAGVVAAILPSRRAATLNVLRAIVTE